MPGVIDLTSAEALDIRLTGGKGASLAKLSHINGVRVPRGFVVTAGEEEPSEEEIAEKLMQFPENTLFAVRSSATAEDMPDASFAGQMDSFLNVPYGKAVAEAVRKCRQSLYTERAVSYRRQNHIELPQMAVVVQTMVPAECAGVMFTADPVSGIRRRIVIEAVEGLGEELVSGRRTPEHYEVQDGRIRGGKLLSDDQIRRLAETGKLIEKEYGCPQDIEWCFRGGKFYFVQSRAVTTLFPLPEKKDDKNHIYMSFSHQQMMTDAIRPFGMYLFLTLGTDGKLQILPVGGRMYGDLSADVNSLIGRKIVFALFGQSDPLSVGAMKELLGRREFVGNLYRGGTKFFSMNAGYFTPEFFWRLLRVPYEKQKDLIPALMKRAEDGSRELAEQLDKLSGAELFDFVGSYQKKLREDLYYAPGMAAVMASVIANAWINKHVEKWTGEKNAADILTQSAPYNVTSEMGLDLLEVADTVRRYPEQAAALEAAEDHNFYENLNPEVTKALQHYFEKYGMRCTGEIDITRPRFLEKPTMIVPMLLADVRNFGEGEKNARIERGMEAYRKKEKELLDRLKGRRAVMLQKKIDILRKYAGYREYPKYFLMNRYWLIKKAFLKEAARLTEAGVISDTEDVWYLTFSEFRQLAETGQADHKLIERRREEHRRYEKLTPPRIMTSDGEMISGSYAAGGKPDGALAGVPVSSGIAQGRARVVTEFDKAVFEEGDILVTKYTDPSWTPAFLSVKGLVTEVGGTMTHGAVIAREYGLPAVVSVENAVRLIRDGQQIRVNGTEGYVELL